MLRFVCQLFLHEFLTGSRSIFCWILDDFEELLGGFTFPAEARKRKSVFGLHRRVRIAYPAFPNCIIFGDFLAGALRKASGTRFLTILSDFGLPGGDHLAPKRHQKMRRKKVVKNGHASQASNGLWAP